MQKRFQQPILKSLYWLGIIGLPCILIGLHLIYNIHDNYNYSGLIELHPLLFSLLSIIVLLDYLISCYLLSIYHPSCKYLFIILTIFLLCTIFFPYHANEVISNNIHLFFACVSFILFNIILYTFVLMSESEKQRYTLILLFCFLHSMMAMQISGLSQMIYAIYVSIFLARKIRSRL